MIMDCQELIEVHDSIGNLENLKLLKVTRCTKLERLPDSTCELGSLKSLDLKECRKLSSLPEGWADRLNSLEELCLDETGIESLPALRGKLKKLHTLSIKNCQFLRSRPEPAISYLESLRELHVMDSPLEGMPENNFLELMRSTGSLRASTSWEFMDALPISCCQSVSELSFTNERIEELTDSIERFRNVKSMALRCKMLKVLPDSIQKLKSLEDLTLQCHSLPLFDKICLPEGIESLNIECVQFEHLSFSTTLGTSTESGSDNVNEGLPATTDACVSTTKVMEELTVLELCAKQITVTPDFSFAPCLVELILKDCEMLTEVHHSIGTLNKLQNLKIIGCNALEELPDTLCHLTSLRRLELTQEFNLSSSPEPWRDLENVGLHETGIRRILTSIGMLSKLKVLYLQKSSSSLSSFKGMKWHRYGTLEISRSCLELVTASLPSFLQSVDELVIMDDQIEELPECPVRQMQKIERLALKCKSLKALPKWVGQLKRLNTFEVYCDDISTYFDEMLEWENIGNIIGLGLECKDMKHLPDSMSRLPGLKAMGISIAGILEFPSWFGGLTNLTALTLKKITTLQTDLLSSGLSQLTSLRYLDLSDNDFDCLPSCISNFSRLKALDVSGCKRLRSIPHLSSSVLKTLDASDCTNLSVLPGFLESLERLCLGGCNSLQYIPSFETIAENIMWLELPGPIGGINSSNLGHDFKNKVFMPALFRKLWHFDMGGNLTTGSNEGHQCLTFLLPDIRFNQQDKFSTVELTLVGISSPVKIVMIMEDDSVLLETLLTEDDFDYNDEDHSKTFSFEKEEYKKISKHLGKSSRTILIWTDVSKLSKVHLKVEFE
ncbi:unnamed protein product [Victoria cruziana]